MKKQVIKKDNYVIVWTPRHRTSRVPVGKLTVYLLIFKSHCFKNAKRRALKALRDERIEYTGCGLVSFGLNPDIPGDYLFYTEPLNMWERMLESRSRPVKPLTSKSSIFGRLK